MVIQKWLFDSINDRYGRMNSQIFLNFSLLSPNCLFRMETTKIIARMNSRIFTNSPFIWFSKFFDKIAIIGMTIFSKISKIIYRINTLKSENSTYFIIFKLSLKIVNLGSKVKNLKISGNSAYPKWSIDSINDRYG